MAMRIGHPPFLRLVPKRQTASSNYQMLARRLDVDLKPCMYTKLSWATTEEKCLLQCRCPYEASKLRRRLVTAAKENNHTHEPSYQDSGDIILKCISRTAEVSALSISATQVVQEAQRRHKAAPTALAALGRALMGTLLLGALKDDAETVQVTFSGDGPLGKMITIASNGGWVKGFVGDSLCDPPQKVNGKLDVGAAVGSGMLSVARNHPSWKQPYIGTVPISSGEIAEDIAHYLADSEQVNTAIGLGVTFNKYGTVQSAQGFLVQVLPFCSEETLARLEENIMNMQPLSDTSERLSAQGILESIFENIGMGEQCTIENPRYGPCDMDELKVRMMRAVACLGSSELQKLLDEQGHVEVRCEFCAEVLRFGKHDLQHIFEESLT